MIEIPFEEGTLSDDGKILGSYKRAGLFGGTFDPIHLGHLQVAQDVKDHFLLNKIIFIPSANPPHKTSKIKAAPRDRIEMTRLAVSTRPDFLMSDIELKRTGPSYSIDTLIYFKRISSQDALVYFILGLDAFLELDTWKSYKALFDQMPFIVMSRPGAASDKYKENRQTVETYLHSKISKGYTFSFADSCFTHREKYPVYLYKVTPMDISSTQIRHHIRKGISIKNLVTENVEHYIRSRGLYQ